MVMKLYEKEKELDDIDFKFQNDEKYAAYFTPDNICAVNEYMDSNNNTRKDDLLIPNITAVNKKNTIKSKLSKQKKLIKKRKGIATLKSVKKKKLEIQKNAVGYKNLMLNHVLILTYVEGEHEMVELRDKIIKDVPENKCESCKEMLVHLKLVLENMKQMREMQELFVKRQDELQKDVRKLMVKASDKDALQSSSQPLVSVPFNSTPVINVASNKIIPAKEVITTSLLSPIQLSFPGYESSSITTTHFSSSTKKSQPPFEMYDLPDSPPPPPELPPLSPLPSLPTTKTLPTKLVSSTPKKKKAESIALPMQPFPPFFGKNHPFYPPFIRQPFFQTSTQTTAQNNWMLSNMEIVNIKNRSHSEKNFAQRLMLRIFPLSERQGRSVYGTSIVKNEQVITKEPLNVAKVEYIKNILFNIFSVSEDWKKAVWCEAKNSMNI